jgi:hypothetical protein
MTARAKKSETYGAGEESVEEAHVAIASTWSISALSDLRFDDTSNKILDRCSLVRALLAEDDMESQVRGGGFARPREKGGGTIQAGHPPRNESTARSMGTILFMVDSAEIMSFFQFT